MDTVLLLHRFLEMAAFAGLRRRVGELAAAGSGLRRRMAPLRVGPVAISALVAGVDRSLDPLLVDGQRDHFAVDRPRERLAVAGEAVLRHTAFFLPRGDLRDRMGPMAGGTGLRFRPGDDPLVQRAGRQPAVSMAGPA